MYPRRFLLTFLLWFQVALNHWNGYGVEACLDYSQYYACDQPGYDYAPYLQFGYPNSYSQPLIYDYSYYTYNPYQDDQQKPIVIIVNNDDHDDEWDLFDIISLITSLKDKPNTEPIYIPYPIPASCCTCDCDCGFDWDCDCYSDCGCKNKGKGKSNCDCGCDDCSHHKKKGRSKSKSHSSRNSGSKAERGRCNKCDIIKHKCDCYC